jgi:hypothetical protein
MAEQRQARTDSGRRSYPPTTAESGKTPTAAEKRIIPPTAAEVFMKGLGFILQTPFIIPFTGWFRWAKIYPGGNRLLLVFLMYNIHYY